MKTNLILQQTLTMYDYNEKKFNDTNLMILLYSNIPNKKQ